MNPPIRMPTKACMTLVLVLKHAETYVPRVVGTSSSIFSLAVKGQTLRMVSRNSTSAWSISSAARILMLRFSRIKANRVVVKLTLPSWSNGIFILMSFLYAKRSGHFDPKPSGGSMFFSISYISE